MAGALGAGCSRRSWGITGREVVNSMTTAMNFNEESNMSLPINAPVGWLTTDEVAKLAQCSPRSVVRAIHLHQINSVMRTTGGLWLINRDEGLEWAETYIQQDE